jgi:hypothetical protein
MAFEIEQPVGAGPSPVVEPTKPRLLGVLGPGLITGASDDDPSLPENFKGADTAADPAAAGMQNGDGGMAIWRDFRKAGRCPSLQVSVGQGGHATPDNDLILAEFPLNLKSVALPLSAITSKTMISSSTVFAPSDVVPRVGGQTLPAGTSRAHTTGSRDDLIGGHRPERTARASNRPWGPKAGIFGHLGRVHP